MFIIQEKLFKYYSGAEGGLLGILIDCMIFLAPFSDVARRSLSTVKEKIKKESRKYEGSCSLENPTYAIETQITLTECV